MNQSLHMQEDLPQLSAKAMELSGEGMLITDARARILAVNPAMCKITGYEKDQIIGNTPRLFKSGYHGELFYKNMWEDLINHGAWKGEILDRKNNGEITSRRLRIKAVYNGHGEATHYIGLMQDTSQLATLTELANKDPLTGLPNRRLFEERLEQAVIRSKRTGKAFAMLYIDLDEFKKINDNWGHITGDRVLKIVAKRLEDMVREEDTVARLGGDEYAIILSEVGNAENTELVLTKIINRINDSCLINKHKLNIGCSIGYSLYPEHTKSVKRLLLLADKNMFAHKNARYIN